MPTQHVKPFVHAEFPLSSPTRQVSSYTLEDIPMTLIVAVVGTDGIVLAADQALVDRTNQGFHRQSLTRKILFNPDKQWWACACSGQRASLAAGHSIRDLCDEMEPTRRCPIRS